MPEIIVTSNPAERGQNGGVLLRERVGVADFESAHFREQLLQRLGWAVGDADAVDCLPATEHETAASQHGAADPPAPRDG